MVGQGEAQKKRPELCPEVRGNASQNGCGPSLAPEGNSDAVGSPSPEGKAMKSLTDSELVRNRRKLEEMKLTRF